MGAKAPLMACMAAVTCASAEGTSAPSWKYTLMMEAPSSD